MNKEQAILYALRDWAIHAINDNVTHTNCVAWVREERLPSFVDDWMSTNNVYIESGIVPKHAQDNEYYSIAKVEEAGVEKHRMAKQSVTSAYVVPLNVPADITTAKVAILPMNDYVVDEINVCIPSVKGTFTIVVVTKLNNSRNGDRGE